jgi:Fe2+ transport system protein B
MEDELKIERATPDDKISSCGNPNVGKTPFNSLTGLTHTGKLAGKTVTNARAI